MEKIAGPEDELFVRSYVPDYRLLIVGAVHIAQKLAILAMEVGYQVSVIDPRRAFATTERFPGVDLLCEWPDEAFERLQPDSQTAVVTLTHDPKLMTGHYRGALNSDAFYIGCLGGANPYAKRVERLTELGLAGSWIVFCAGRH